MNGNPKSPEIGGMGGWFAVAALFAVTMSLSGNVPAQQVIKKSSSGVCHCPGGQFYDRTSSFEPFENINACLESGGREPRSGQGDCSVAAAIETQPVQAAPENAAVGPVKKSSSGLCHCPGGQFYNRTTNFTPFDTIGACLESGGREPRQGQGTCPTEPPPPSATSLENYDRDAFGGWADADEDCMNTRHELLQARSTDAVGASSNGCSIDSGQWNDFYTGNIVTTSSELDIDHVVPLRWAWERGAYGWAPEKRLEFANDPANLLPVGASVNRSKGASGPLEWLPPNESFACEYVLRFNRVIDRYELAVPAEEAEMFATLIAEQCD